MNPLQKILRRKDELLEIKAQEKRMVEALELKMESKLNQCFERLSKLFVEIKEDIESENINFNIKERYISIVSPHFNTIIFRLEELGVVVYQDETKIYELGIDENKTKKEIEQIIINQIK